MMTWSCSFKAYKKINYLIIALAFVSNTGFALEKSVTKQYRSNYLFQNSSVDTTPQVWGSVEYLSERIKNEPIDVPLITTSPLGTPRVTAGVINAPGTQILFGAGSNQNDIHFNNFNGGRLTLGAWLDCCTHFGVEGSAFALKEKSTSFQASSGNNPILTIPFINSITNHENAALISFPGINAGSISVKNSSRLWSWDANGLLNITSFVPLTNRGNFQIIGLGGFRALTLNEEFTMNSGFTIPSIPAISVNFSDSFQTRNRFYGVQFGARGSLNYYGFTTDVTTKIALGRNFETQQINGQTNVSISSGMPTNSKGGVFALNSNIGSFHQSQFAFMPEIQARLGYKITPNIHPYVGYNFLYINHVIRPANQINRTINPNEFPPPIPGGSPAPLPVFNTSSYWAQGVNVGLEISL